MDLYVENVARRIETDRLLLRPYERADFQDLTNRINDFDVSCMLTQVPYPYTLADAEDFYDMRESADIGVLWIIEVAGSLAGAVSIGKELGYWLAKSFWGKGYMSEAAQAAVRTVFSDTNLDEIRSSHFEENTASKNVLRKLGFEDIGGHEHFSKARNAPVPGRQMVLTRARWEAEHG